MTRWETTWRLVVLALLAAFGFCAPAAGGSVYVTTDNEEIGHAWLFGSRDSASRTCWLAVPRHVVLAFDRESLLPFRFKLNSGAWGESGPPVAVSEIPGALEASAVDDLAFARVLVGPGPDECLDRLGLPSFAYQAALNRRDPLYVFSMLPGSFGNFQVGVETAMSGNGGLLRLGTVDAADGATYFKQGLSGAVAALARPSGTDPFAMILSVDGGQALALRFDRIRAAFDLVEASALAAERQHQSATTGLPYDITAFEGISRGSGPATALAAEGGCWRVAPQGGKRGVTITVTPPEGALRGVSVEQATGCGSAPLDVIIDQRPRGASGWTLATRCTSVHAVSPDLAACRLDLRSSPELRITVVTTAETGISALRLY
jgi:hypothetical protein